MPRKRAKGKWNLKMSPDEWYLNPDPWKIQENPEEQLKTDLIRGLMSLRATCIDIGCGEGHHMVGDTGIDISYIAIGRARRYYPEKNFSVVDIRDGRLNGPFDVIVMREVLYYINPHRWDDVEKNIYDMFEGKGQFIISCGQYFTEEDIRKIFSKIEFDKVFKLPSKKYEYNLIMSGYYVTDKKVGKQ